MSKEIIPLFLICLTAMFITLSTYRTLEGDDEDCIGENDPCCLSPYPNYPQMLDEICEVNGDAAPWKLKTRVYHDYNPLESCVEDDVYLKVYFFVEVSGENGFVMFIPMFLNFPSRTDGDDVEFWFQDVCWGPKACGWFYYRCEHDEDGPFTWHTGDWGQPGDPLPDYCYPP